MPDSKPPKNGNGRATIIAIIAGTVINIGAFISFGTFCYTEMSETRASTSMLSQAVMDQKEIMFNQKELLENHIEHLREADRGIKETVVDNKKTIEDIRDMLMEMLYKKKK